MSSQNFFTLSGGPRPQLAPPLNASHADMVVDGRYACSCLPPIHFNWLPPIHCNMICVWYRVDSIESIDLPDLTRNQLLLLRWQQHACPCALPPSSYTTYTTVVTSQQQQPHFPPCHSPQALPPSQLVAQQQERACGNKGSFRLEFRETHRTKFGWEMYFVRETISIIV